MSDTQQQQQPLTQEVAIKALIQGVMVAQSRGTYTLDEAEMLSRAIKVFTKTIPKTPTPPKSEETIVL